VFALALGIALPASGATVPAPRPDPAAYRELANQIIHDANRVREITSQIDAAVARIADLQEQIARTRQQLDSTRSEIERHREAIRKRAALIYTHARSPQVVLTIARIEDVSTGTQYAESATISDVAAVEKLTRIAETIDRHRVELESEHDDQTQQRDSLQRAKTLLGTTTIEQRKLLDRLVTVTIMGKSAVTSEQITAWFESRSTHYQLVRGTTIADLATLFVEEGIAEHVRGDVAFAQAVLETGWFAHALDSNFGGIGACDECTGEIPFPTPRDGVRGQIQMLRNYADPASRAENLANPPAPGIYGSDPIAAATSYDTFFAKGRVPTWNLMGNGNWATSTEYSVKVLSLYFDMVAFAAGHT